MPFTKDIERKLEEEFEPQIEKLHESQLIRKLAWSIVIACDKVLGESVRRIPYMLANSLFLQMHEVRKQESSFKTFPHLTNMEIGSAILYDDGYVQRAGDRAPEWHDQLVRQNGGYDWKKDEL